MHAPVFFMQRLKPMEWFSLAVVALTVWLILWLFWKALQT